MSAASEKRKAERTARIAELGPRPRWWRPFSRRRWQRTFDAIMAIDASQIAELFRELYPIDEVMRAIDRPNPFLGTVRRGADYLAANPDNRIGEPGAVYECPVHGRFVPTELPRYDVSRPEAKCMAWVTPTSYCGIYAPLVTS